MTIYNKIKTLLSLGIIFAFMLPMFIYADLALAVSTCGTGTWTSGNLEIHHINIGQGDSTLIVGPTGKSLLFDAGESYWNSSIDAQTVGPYIESVLGCKELDYVVISHFQADHIGYVGYGGLYHLVETQGFTVGSTLIRDYNSYLGETGGTFTNWKTYFEGTGQAKINPATAIEGTSQVDLGVGVAFDIVTVDGNGAIIAGDFSGDASPPSENDYSIGAVISFGDFDEWIGGDLSGQYEVSGFGYAYHDIELSVAPEVGDVDVYKVNHHGSSHSSSATFINQIDPEVSIVSVGDANTYGHPTQSVMDRLLATSDVYMTERGDTNTNIGSAIVAGNITIKTSDGSIYTVNGIPYTATEPTRTDVDEDGYFAEADPNDGDNSITPAPNGGCGSIYQSCSFSCDVNSGQVFINEILPAPSSGSEWVELYNYTSNAINIGYCHIDDIVAGSSAYQIPAGTIIPAHGFWTLDRTSYFNNAGDDVRFLKEDATTVLDSYSYGSTGYDVSWFRLSDGGLWGGTPTSSTTKGLPNSGPSADLFIGDIKQGNYALSSSETIFESYTNTIDGPIRVVCLAGTQCFTTQIVNSGSSYNELAGFPVEQFTTEYWFPYYDHGYPSVGGDNMRTWILVGNPDDTQTAEVDITIGGVLKGSYSIAPGANVTPRWIGLVDGPVQVKSTNGVNIFASERVFTVPYNSFNEVMGLPANQFTTEYWFPWYDTVYMDTYLLVGNTSSTTAAEVDIYIGENLMGSYTIAVNDTLKVSYPNIVDGPVRVVSTNGVDIVTSEFTLSGTENSFNEVMGYPFDQFDTEYWYPYYDHGYPSVSGDNMRTWILVGNPSDTDTANVDIYIDGVLKDSYAIAPGANVTPRWIGEVGGPVRVVSDIPVFTSERVFTVPTNAFNEFMGIPLSQFSTEYWFTWYDSVYMDNTVVISKP